MEPRLEALATELVQSCFEFSPGAALFAGQHQHDRRLDDVSAAAFAAHCQALERLRARVSALSGLGARDEIERDVVLAKIDGTLFEIRELGAWRHDPYFYAETLSSQLNGLIIFEFAAAEERLLSAIAKERQIPAFLDNARRNLEPTAEILVDYGIRGFEGALCLVRDDLPRVLGAGASPSLRKALEGATAQAVASIEAFLGWLRTDYPRGPEQAYRLGRTRFEGWLAQVEGLSTPVPALEAWAVAEIERRRRALAAAAAELDAAASPGTVVERIVADHPKTGSVVAATRRIADEVWEWMRARRLVSFPSEERVRIADTPEFMRWSFGSMWTPGAWEKSQVRATFYATDADPAWPVERQEQHLTAFSYRGLENLAIHEAYPGHYIQMLHQNRVDSPVRRAFWWGVFGEGWAHYCEEVALEEGFGAGVPEVRIVALQEALTRLCRFVHCLRLHAGEGWSFEQGTAFFAREAWLSEAVARAECERAAFDPFYLRYTLGKKFIVELRAELQAELGSRFDLRAFHDALLASASAPMPAMRRLTRLALGLAA